MVWDFDTSSENQEKLERLAEKVWEHPLYFIACGFGVGLMPIFPGTFGALVGLVIFGMLSAWPLWAYLVFVLLGGIFAIGLCEWVVRQTGLSDPTCACIDEVVGMLVALIGVPKNAYWIALAFLLFRLLDIFKPWPFSWLDQHVKGGFGMVLDDVVIGLVTTLLIQLLAGFFL